MKKRNNKGFTLIELLIVVAIIGIIVAIAIPNLLNAIQRAKQKRTMGDMRTAGTAAEAYAVDFNHYPAAAAAYVPPVGPHRSSGDHFRRPGPRHWCFNGQVVPTYIRVLPLVDGWDFVFPLRHRRYQHPGLRDLFERQRRRRRSRPLTAKRRTSTRTSSS